MRFINHRKKRVLKKFFFSQSLWGNRFKIISISNILRSKRKESRDSIMIWKKYSCNNNNNNDDNQYRNHTTLDLRGLDFFFHFHFKIKSDNFAERRFDLLEKWYNYLIPKLILFFFLSKTEKVFWRDGNDKNEFLDR